MHFGQPAYIYLLILGAPLILFLAWASNRKKLLAEQFATAALLPRLVREQTWQGRKTRTRLILLTLLFMTLAMAQPKWGFEWEDLKQEGVDIIIAVDVSQSMLATDIKPSRLARAKHKITDLLEMLDGDRIGLVAFAGTSFLQCPLTLDYQAAGIFLDALGTDLIPVQGTSIAHALRTAIKAFSRMEKKSKAIILITDGEDHGGNLEEVARLARAEGVKIFAIGVGQETGAPIPSAEPGHGFKKDSSGEVILSKFNESLLQKIAVQSGGSYVRSVIGDMDLQKIYLEDIKQRIETKELRTSRRKRWQERFQWMLALALLCLTAERAVREK